MIIRPAKKGDYSQVAPLIVQAMEDLACTFVNSKNVENAYPLFEHFFQLPENQYSYQHTLVFEADGVIAGSLITYDGCMLPLYRAPFLEYIKKNYGVHDLVIENETMPGELYIDTLSVSPKFQGQGIGKRLLRAAENLAREEGLMKIGLLVDYNNPNAKRLYLALGYKSVGRKQLGDGIYEHLQLQLD